MRIVIDTNVIASALFYGGKPYHLLRYIMEEQVDVWQVRRLWMSMKRLFIV